MSKPKTTIDLDAARAARREQRGDAPELILDGKVYVLPDELPADAVHAFGAISAGDFTGLKMGMEALFGGPEEWATIQAAAKAGGSPLSFEDEVFILEEAFEGYGMTLGESPASESSS